MQKCQGWVEQGGALVVTSGVSSTTKVQKSFPLSTVSVYDAGTLNLSTIYSDDGITPKANPFTSSSTSYFFFFAANGVYDITFSGTGITVPFTLSSFILNDPEAAIESINGLTAADQTITTGTTGTNFNIVSSTATHTLNLPVASATNTGKLSSADWSNFDAKEEALTFSSPLSRSVNTVSLGTVGIANGGTQATTVTTAFNNLSPTTTKGDLITRNSSNNVRLGVGTDGYALVADSGQTTGLKWAPVPTSPVVVAEGGTGATSLTGIPVGTGTSALTAVAASSRLQTFRRAPNGAGVTYEFATPPYLVSSDYDFTAQSPSGTLSAGVGATATLSPVPLGLNGSDTGHYIYIAGTGTPEACLITGGSAVAGASSGTITFMPANNHSAGWTIASATSGVQEAIIASPAGVNEVWITQGTVTLNASLSYAGKTNLVLKICNGVTLAGSGAFPTTAAGTFIDDYRSGMHFPNVGANLTSGATIAPTSGIHHVTGTAAIDNITVPANFIGGVIYLIPNGVFTLTTGGNVAIASTATVGRLMILAYDPGTSKWYPSY